MPLKARRRSEIPPTSAPARTKRSSTHSLKQHSQFRMNGGTRYGSEASNISPRMVTAVIPAATRRIRMMEDMIMPILSCPTRFVVVNFSVPLLIDILYLGLFPSARRNSVCLIFKLHLVWSFQTRFFFGQTVWVLVSQYIEAFCRCYVTNKHVLLILRGR